MVITDKWFLGLWKCSHISYKLLRLPTSYVAKFLIYYLLDMTRTVIYPCKLQISGNWNDAIFVFSIRRPPNPCTVNCTRRKLLWNYLLICLLFLRLHKYYCVLIYSWRQSHGNLSIYMTNCIWTKTIINWDVFAKQRWSLGKPPLRFKHF